MIEDFVTFAGYSIASQLKYTFNDTQSSANTLPTDTVDYCGEKILSFTVDST